jgi:hypothetical protein
MMVTQILDSLNMASTNTKRLRWQMVFYGCIGLLFICCVAIKASTIPIHEYLKSNLIGMPVIYEVEGKYKKSVCIDVVKNKAEFDVILVNKDRARVGFQMNFLNQLRRGQSDEVPAELQEHIFKTQQVITNAISQISNSGNTFISSTDTFVPNPSLLGIKNPNQVQKQLQDGEEILYTEFNSNAQQSGIAFATWEGVFLQSQPQVQLELIFKKEKQ